MIAKLRASFKKNPRLYYTMSIAATWAGSGSFIVGTQVAQNEGIWPWLLWAVGNTLSCIAFGIIAPKFPKLREVFASKPMQIILGLMCVFQIWVNMNGIFEMLSPTVIGPTISYIIVYGLSAFFIIFYLKRATFRNVASDNLSWILVYLLLFVLVAISAITTGVHGISTAIVPAHIGNRAWIGFALIWGAFMYPTFWELLDYNDANEDETKKIDMKRPFIMGGLLFGFYLLFVLAGALTTYTPATSLLKGVMVSLIAISSLSSFLYGAMINFGKKLGVIIDVAAVAGWQLTIPLGVMGVWTLNQNVRVWFVFAAMIIAYIWHRKEKRKAVKAQ